MVLLRNLCIFIIVEQFLLSNLEVFNTTQYILEFGSLNLGANIWIQLVSSVLQIGSTSLFVKGIIEKKPHHFYLWLYFNGISAISLTVLYISSIMERKLLTEVFGSYNTFTPPWLLAYSVLRWTIWIIGFMFYNRESKKKLSANVKTTTTSSENKSRVPGSQYQTQCTSECLPMYEYQMYPRPSAPAESDTEVV